MSVSLKINRRIACGIIATFVRNGVQCRHQPQRGGPTRHNFTEEMREALIAYVEEKLTTTLNEMRTKLLELFSNLPVSKSTISRNLDASLVTSKLLRSASVNWNFVDVKEER